MMVFLSFIRSRIFSSSWSNSLDALEVDLRGSYDDLGLIIGQSVSDEIMDKVFKEFCVGK